MLAQDGRAASGEQEERQAPGFSASSICTDDRLVSRFQLWVGLPFLHWHGDFI
jgi:hypothetical protein